MLYLISYDVSTATPQGQKRLRQVARLCENHGVRVQKSVFECTMRSEIYVSFKAKLQALINAEEDSLRIYPMGAKAKEKVIHLGKNTAIDLESPLIL